MTTCFNHELDATDKNLQSKLSLYLVTNHKMKAIYSIIFFSFVKFEGLLQKVFLTVGNA